MQGSTMTPETPQPGSPGLDAQSAEIENLPPSYGPLHPFSVWRRLRHDRPALFGGFLGIGFVLMGILAPLIAPYPPRQSDLNRMNEAPFWIADAQQPQITAPAGPLSLFGRDVAGRDIFSRVVHGTRTSLVVGVAVVTIASFIGVSLGSVAGYAGGIVDTLIMRAVDMLLAFPFLVLAIAVVSVFPHATLFHIALALGCTSWPGICRLMRAQVLSTREQDYVKAAQALGASHLSILLRHIFPNCIAPVVIWFTMGIAGAVMAEASLSFLGFGQPDSVSWGTMIDDGLRKADFPSQWWPVFFPAAALASLVLAFNLLGDGLQDAINPKLKK